MIISEMLVPDHHVSVVLRNVIVQHRDNLNNVLINAEDMEGVIKCGNIKHTNRAPGEKRMLFKGE